MKKRDVKQIQEQNMDLDLDKALEEVAQKLRPSANMNDDEESCTEAGSCVHTTCWNCY